MAPEDLCLQVCVSSILNIIVVLCVVLLEGTVDRNYFNMDGSFLISRRQFIDRYISKITVIFEKLNLIM